MSELYRAAARLLAAPDFDDILLVCHDSPDGDTLGSAFALCRALKMLNKRCAVSFEKRDDHTFDFITDCAGQIDFEVKKLVTVDVADLKLVSSGIPKSPDAVIDHHRLNSIDAPFKLVLADHASCGEIVFGIIEELGVDFDEYTARALYTAIATDTGRFLFSNTTKRTFEIAARLCSFVPGGNFSDINNVVFDTSSIEKLRIEAYAVQHVLLTHGGEVASLGLDKPEMDLLSSKESDFDNLINILRRIEGVRVCVFAREKNGSVKFSVRSKGAFDCSALCARFGGGGHSGAAGCNLDLPVKEALAKVLAAIDEAL
ncbi:MAG: DHH family phosphoesterase [Clostridia bacterium]|nr:DHH family phosphoesterase [Clostridia bacterium]